MQRGTILSCVEEQTSSATEGGNQPRTYEINVIFLRQVSIPFVQMIVFCHAELLICATVLQQRLSIDTIFLSFQIQDNEDDFRGTAQYGLMLSHLYCLMCLLQMCQHRLQDEAAS